MEARNQNQQKKVQGQFVIQTKNGQVVRVINWHMDVDKAFIVKKAETDRIEVTSGDRIGEDDLTLGEVSQSQVKKSPVALNDDLEIAHLSNVFHTEKNIPVAREDKQEEKYHSILRISSVAHIGLVLLCLMLSQLIIPWLEPEEIIVKITPEKIERPKFSKTVAVSNTKIDRKKKVSRKKVVSKKVKPKKYAKKARVTNSKNKRGQSRSKVNVSKTGALGVLGGMKSGSKNSAGLNLNSVSNSRGSGVSGRGGRGGHSRAIPGKGLIAAGVGTGGKARGSGGYATNGKGGGRPGYGKRSMRGASGAYFQPLEDEALVQGGLDRDQIAAVINRNMGQVVYCYEKGLQTKPKLGGRVNLRWVIGANGRVKAAKVASSSLKSAKVESCLVKKLSGWKFPKPHGNVSVRVMYPFTLKRVGAG